MTHPGADKAHCLRLWDAIRIGDVPAARAATVSALDAGNPGSSIIRDALAPAQVAIGEMWQRAECSVADEHVATAAVDAALAVIEHSDGRTATGQGPLIALVCAESEWHTLPTRMAAQLLRERGADARFLGASIPADQVHQYLVRQRPDVVAVSVTLSTSLPGAARTVAAAAAAGAPVVVGGAAVTNHPGRAYAIGADACPARAEGILDSVGSTSAGAKRREPHWDLFLSLQQQRPAAVDAAFHDLRGALQRLSTGSPELPDHSRADLHHILDYAATAVLVNDDSVLAEFTCWLCEVSAARGVAAGSLVAAYRALAAHVSSPAVQILLGLADELQVDA